VTQVKVVNDSNGNVNKSRSNYRCKIDNIKGVIFPGEIKEHHYPKWQSSVAPKAFKRSTHSACFVVGYLLSRFAERFASISFRASISCRRCAIH
jgi:hypothetical protein